MITIARTSADKASLKVEKKDVEKEIRVYENNNDNLMKKSILKALKNEVHKRKRAHEAASIKLKKDQLKRIMITNELKD